MAAAYPSQPQGPNWWNQSHEQQLPSNSNASQAIGPATLLIRHLPEAIPLDTLSRLFSHYGASSVRPCTAGRLKNCAFVDFKDETAALQAYRQLNGLRFLGKVLSVEKASQPKDGSQQLGAEGNRTTTVPSVKDDSKARDAQDGSKSGLPTAEPIAAKLGVDYPYPPHLEYAYPPPDGNILTNIVNALIAVPRFYTQVLHLMNKMNIPAPFRMALPTPPLPAAALAPPPPPPIPPPTVGMPQTAEASSDESEMDTSDEEYDGGAEPKTKRIKRDIIVGPAVDKDVAHEAVGLKPATLVPKEKPVIKKKNPVLQIKIVPKQVQQEDKFATTPKEPEKEEVLIDRPYAILEEIEAQKLPPEEILSLPMFKNYTAGNPAMVLYIKNLSKDVVPDDFYFIFGSLFGSIDAAKTGLSVKLMQIRSNQISKDKTKRTSPCLDYLDSLTT